MKPIDIPVSLHASCQHSQESIAWLDALPGVIAQAKEKWQLDLDAPFDGEEVSCSWVAFGTRRDGTEAVLKAGMPHYEGLHELEGLLHWKGTYSVRVLDYIQEPRVMLLERCVPGTRLRQVPEVEQDKIIATLLKKLWQKPAASHPFRMLAEVLAVWKKESLEAEKEWPDPGLTRMGLTIFDQLPHSADESVVLACDLHAGNVLKAEREPWLVIDPKPFVGDPAYDATQHLFNCRTRLYTDPIGTINRMADLLEVSRERVRLWMFARAAAEPRLNWAEKEVIEFARKIAP